CTRALARFGTGGGTEFFHWLIGTISPASDEALREFDAALAIRPRFVEARLFRGHHFTYAYDHDAKKAVEDISAALTISTDYPAAYILRGQQLQELGDLDGAIADFSEFIRRKPGNADG